MIRNYLRTALRFLKKNKVFAGINILGLSIALATSFVILLFVINELSYENQHKKRKQIYRVLNHLDDFNMIIAGTSYVMADVLEEELPQVEIAIRARHLRAFKLRLGDEFVTQRRAVATDSEVFDMFNIPLVGSAISEKLLEDQNAIVISRSMAEKFFPGEDPVGKDMLAFFNDEELTFTVYAVFENIPGNTTFRAECFVNKRWTLQKINISHNTEDTDVNWDRDFWNTYVLLSENADAALLEEQFRAIESKYLNPQKYTKKKHFSLQNLSDIYLGSDNVGNSFIKGSRKNVRMFSGIALLIVLIAAINYILLSTAVSTSRAKEIGIRKTAGASDKIIRGQLLSESVILALMVLPFAILLMWLGIPQAERLFSTTLTIYHSNLIIYILVYLVLTIIIGIASGLYTSFYLSRLKVMEILNNTLHSGEKRKIFRSALIIIQLIIFCSFVSGTLIIRSQYKFAINIDPGYTSKNIVMVDMGRGFKGYTPYINSIGANANVKLAGGTMSGLPMVNSMSSMYPHFTNDDQMVKVEGMAVDYNFLETMGIQIEGRSFSKEYGTDLEEATIFNETAIRALGIDDPIGRKFGIKTIIGVAKDFNLHTIHTEIPPIRINLNDRYIQEVAVSYEPGTLDQVLPMLREEWEKIAPDRPFNYYTIEDLTANLYGSEKRLGTIVSVSAIFTLLIAAMGIFGLTLFVARSRTNEIGIRKVFGSGEWPIVRSFLRSNFILVVLAEVISVPVTIFFMKRWLESFSYRTSIHWWIFVLTFALASIVVLLTVFIQSYRSSRINPIDALRYE